MSIKGSPRLLSPTSLFTVPQASTPPRPHSHDPQRRATFGTTSPRCTYGEGLASPCRRWPLARVIVPTTVVVACICAHAHLCTYICSMVDGRRSLTHRAPPGARKFIGTVSRHDQVSGCFYTPSIPSSFSSSLAPLFFCIFRLTFSLLSPRTLENGGPR